MRGFIIVDKPANMTSHDVVSVLRKIYHTKQVGHAGTLDPMATGVLPVAIGKATRMIEYMMNDTKTYVVSFQFGFTSDTLDSTGELTRVDCTERPSYEELENLVHKMQGNHDQIPPMYSAKKVQGKKLYDLARQGKTIERKPVPITVFNSALLSYDGDQGTLLFHVSKGTYVRSLVDDIGKQLGCGAIMTELRRIQSGAFTVDDAVALGDLEMKEDDALASFLLPLDQPFHGRESFQVDSEQAQKLRYGQRIGLKNAENIECIAIYDEDGFIGPGRVESNTLKMIKVIG